MNVNTADVIIVGAGIAGCSTAYYLRKKGLSCILLEEEMIGHGGSSRNGGYARQSGRDEREIGLAIFATQHIWPNLSEELGVNVEYHQSGYLVCGYDDAHLAGIKNRIKVAEKYGLEMQLKVGDEIKEICPHVSDHVTCAGWTPSDATANPLTATLGFYKRARELGARFITGEKVSKIGKNKGRARQVVTSRGTVYEGDKLSSRLGTAAEPLSIPSASTFRYIKGWSTSLSPKPPRRFCNV